MLTFVDRLTKCAMRAGLSVSDLANWFETPYPTMRSWLHGTRVPPEENVERLLGRLDQLEQHVKTNNGFPVPFGLGGRKRPQFIKKVRDGRRTRFSSEGVA